MLVGAALGLVFWGSFLSMLLVERIVHGLTFFFVDTLLGGGEGHLKRVVSLQSTTEFFEWGLDMLNSVPNMVVAILSYLLSRILWLCVFTGLLVIWIILYQAAPSIILDVVYVYNTSISPAIRAFLLVPLQYADLFFSPLVVLYNMFVYTSKQMITQVLFPTIRGVATAGPTAFLQLMTALVDFIKELVLSLVMWWGSLYGDCAVTGKIGYIMNASMSREPVILANTTGNEINCFEPGLRSLNLMSPMAKLRLLAAHAGDFVKLSCVVLSPVFDVVLFPFLDINLAKFVHNTVNALLFWVVHMPLITLERCELSRERDDTSAWYHKIMCLPDATPGWNMLISGFRSLGMLVDNWFNIVFIIFNQALNLPVPQCAQIDLELKSETEENLFGGRESRFVGLTTGAYAVTDGISTQYNLFSGQITQIYAPDNWPLEIEQRYGIAAVSYAMDDEIDSGSMQQTLSMFGCSCMDIADADKGSRMQIQCGIARYNPAVSVAQQVNLSTHAVQGELLVPIEFALPSTAWFMTCAETKIVVDSVRWPVSRVSIPGEFINLKSPLDEFVNKDGVDMPDTIDAVIWVMPACRVEGTPSAVCRKDFPETACFPFCAAARQTGSRNNGMLLYSADDWTKHVQLLRRDCADGVDATSLDSDTSPVYNVDGVLPKDYTGVVSQSTGDFLGGTTLLRTWDPTVQRCVFNDQMSSRLLRTDEVASDMSQYGYSVLDEQPFAVAGEVVLTSVQDSDGSYKIKVQRMYGLEGTDMFSLITVNNKLEANSPCSTPKSCLDTIIDGNFPTIPYSWFKMPLNHNPAVASKWGVFFAVNPSLDMFSEYFKHCQEMSTQIQFVVESSYAPVRIWRVDAFAYRDPNSDWEPETGKVVELEDMFNYGDTTQCGNAFNIMVTSMEYLNDANIAVQVMHTSPKHFMTSTGTATSTKAADVQYRTYFLHPRTMQMRRFEMWVDNDAPVYINQGLLCPSQRRMPDFGSMFTEMMVAVMYFGRMVTEFITIVPVVFQQGVYMDISTCIPLTRGHSFLRNCGQGFLDFDPMFLAIRRSNKLFWNSLTKIGGFVSGTAMGDNLQQFLNGAAMYGGTRNNPLMLANMRSYISSVGRIEKVSMGQAVESFKTIGGMSPSMRGALGVSVSMARAAHYILVVTRKVVMYVVFNTVPGRTPVSGLWQAMYDSMDRYETLILDGQREACVGVALMMGYSNPIAGLSMEACQAGALFQKGVLQVALTLFVDVPTLACLCQQKGTVLFKENALKRCWEPSPLHMRGVIISIIQGASTSDDICFQMTGIATENLRGSMNEFIDMSYRSTEHVAEAADYIVRVLLPIDVVQSNEHCTANYATNPYVATIVPDPVDYWRMCGSTGLCKSKCRSSIQAFEDMKNARHMRPGSGSTVVGDTVVESLFFRDEDVVSGRSVSPFTVVDMLEIVDCSEICQIDQFATEASKDRCVSVLGITERTGIGDVQVADYCIPAAMELPVRQYLEPWAIVDSASWVANMRNMRLVHQGLSQCRLFTGAGVCSIVVVFQDRVSMFRADGVEYILVEMGRSILQMQRVISLFTFAGDTLLLHGSGVKVKDSDTAFDVGYKSFCIDVSTRRTWGNYLVTACDQQNTLNPYDMAIPVCVMNNGKCNRILFMPTIETDSGVGLGHVRSCPVNVLNAWSNENSCIELPHSRGATRAAGLVNAKAVGGMPQASTWVTSAMHSMPVLASAVTEAGQSTSTFSLLVANHPAKRSMWLSDMRISRKDGTISTHTSMQRTAMIELQHACSVKNCMGCVGDVQRMCFVAQQCTIMKCIGTTVNMNRPLCGIGAIIANHMEMTVSYMHSTWLILVDIFAQVIELSTGYATAKGSEGLSLVVLEEAFAGQVCETKDIILSSAGFLTSFINVFLNRYTSDTGSDPNVIAMNQYNEAVNTMTMTSITFLIGQLGLGLLYPVIAAKKALMCQGTDLFAMLDFTGLKIRIAEADTITATEALAGKCLTEYHSEVTQQSQDISVSFAAVSSQLLSSAMEFGVSLPFGALKHAMDAGLTYIISVIRGIQDLIQTADRKNCKLPDISAADVPKCACGDTAVQIPTERGGGSIAESAFWCTGVLLMTTSFGVPRLVFNPYTYNELLASMNQLDDYLICISSVGSHEQCADMKPSKPILERQGMSTMAVFVRCKANYNNMQWDEGAAVLFVDEADIPTEMHAVKQEFLDARTRANLDLTSAMGLCMRKTLQDEVMNEACFVDIELVVSSVKRERYFMYETIAGLTGSQHIAACEVFTGPADAGVAVFMDCIDGAGSDDCFMQPFAWSGRSKNKVPVAVAHAFMSYSPTERATRASERHVATLTMLMDAFAKVETWSGEFLEVSLFTAEGDLLHQAFDCALLGPYGRTDMWPADIEDVLPTISYFRDTLAGKTRDFELPCSGDALRGDHSAPYTCGADVRRSIIKYFVRNFTGIADNGNNAMAKTAVVNGVLAQIQHAKALFGNIGTYGCLCPESADVGLGPMHVECCTLWLGAFDPLINSLHDISATDRHGILENLMSPVMREFTFSSVEKTLEIDQLLNRIMNYSRHDIWRNTETMTSYHDNKGDYVWDESDRTLAADEALFSSTEDIKKYSAEDVSDPLHVSPFAMCMGLLSQVLFTIPTINSAEFTQDDGDTRDVPTTLGSLSAFDPMVASPDEHLSSMEYFVSSVVQQAASKSPVFWSHWVRHQPSDSLVCEDEAFSNASAVFEVFTTMEYEALSLHGLTDVVHEHVMEDVSVYGVVPPFPTAAKESTAVFRSMRSKDASIGSIRVMCFCGWDYTDTAANGRRHCKIPDVICDHRDWSVFNEAGVVVSTACNERSGMYDHEQYDYAIAIMMQFYWSAVEPSADFVCASMAPSSAWGISNVSQMNAWLNGAAYAGVNIKDIAQTGRSGVRMGNIAEILSGYASMYHPGTRTQQLYHASEPHTGHAQRRCVGRNTTDPKTPSGNFSGYARAWVDDLIPVVQGVEQSRPEAYCMRYVVELGLLQLYKHVLGETHSVTIKQLEASIVWKRRCKTQMKMLGFCSLRGIFGASDSRKAAATSHTNDKCPFNVTATPSDTRVEIADNCLVVVVNRGGGNGVEFYDPCVCVQLENSESVGNSICSDMQTHHDVPLDDIVAQCQSMNPLALLGNTSKLHTLHWSSFEDDNVFWTQDTSRVETLRAAHLKYHKHNSVLDENAINALVDMNMESLWKEYVKPYATSTARNAEEPTCGAVSDWWPETWKHPVGFHPTTQCSADTGADTPAYRSFQNSVLFMEGLGMVYTHDALRDTTFTRSMSGASGVCRASNLAVVMRNLNNARVCTRQRKGVFVDYAVPVLGDAPEDYFDEECSRRDDDVPWDVGDASDPGLMTSGLMTSWPDDGVWPAMQSQRTVPLSLGLPTHQVSDTWKAPEQTSTSCGMPSLFLCETDTDCWTNAHDSALSDSMKLKCRSGVCTVASAAAADWNLQGGIVFECSRHSECDEIGEGFLCSGEGRCVTPVVEFWNERATSVRQRDTIELEWYTRVGKCNSTNADGVDMFGSSTWGDVHGVLQAHGMCKYRNWYEYNHLYNGMGCSAQDPSCTIPNANEASWPMTSDTREAENAPSMFEQSRMRMNAHVCDRDYQHLHDFEMCQPNVQQMLELELMPRVKYDALTQEVQNLESYEFTLPNNYAKRFQTYYRSSATPGDSYLSDFQLDLLAMQHRDNKQAGWLGVEEEFNYNPANADATLLEPVRCDTIAQCSLPAYTINGVSIADREVGRQNGVNAFTNYAYEVKDVIKCGAFGKRGHTIGFSGENYCSIDKAVLPMYQMLCTSTRSVLETAGCKLNSGLQDKCSVIDSYYEGNDVASMKTRGEVQTNINSLLSSIESGFDSLVEYADQMSCADAIWSQLQTETVKTKEFSNQYQPVEGVNVRSDSALYVFTSYSFVELPFMWWLKCYLLSGVIPLATTPLQPQRVQCAAWDYYSRQTHEREEVDALTVRQYLQRYAPKLTEATIKKARIDTESKHENAVRTAVVEVQHKAIPGDGNQTIMPSCYMTQSYQSSSDCKTNDRYSRAKYKIVYSGSLMEEAGKQDCCTSGTGPDSCTPSDGLENANKSIDVPDVLAVVEEYVLEEIDADFLKDNVNVLDEKIRVSDHDNVENNTIFPLFNHDWLRHEPNIGSIFSTYVKDSYTDDVYTSGNSECSTIQYWETERINGETTCIFLNKETDPAYKEGDIDLKPRIPPYVRLSTRSTNAWVVGKGIGDSAADKETKMTSSDILQSAINVCADRSSRAGSFLQQSCHLRGMDNTHETEEYTCSSSNECPLFGSESRSPKKNFVCYEAENECFLGAEHKGDFANGEGLGNQWAMGSLPPGVRVMSYGVDGDAPLVGRNPKFLGPNQRVYWNGTFFDRSKLYHLLGSETTKVLVGSTKQGNEILRGAGGRRLLQRNPDNIDGTKTLVILTTGWNMGTRKYWDIEVKELDFKSYEKDDPLHDTSCADLRVGKDYQWIETNEAAPRYSKCRKCKEGWTLKKSSVEEFWDEVGGAKYRLCSSSNHDGCCVRYTWEGKTWSVISHDVDFHSCGIGADIKCELGYIRTRRFMYEGCTSVGSTFCTLGPDGESVKDMVWSSVDSMEEFTSNTPVFTWNVSIAAGIGGCTADVCDMQCVEPSDHSKPQDCTMFKMINVAEFLYRRTGNQASTYPPWLNCRRSDDLATTTFLDDVLNYQPRWKFLTDTGFFESQYDSWVTNRYGHVDVYTNDRQYRENFFKDNMDKFQNTWFDYAYESTPHYRAGTDTNTLASDKASTTSFYFPAKYKSFSLELDDGWKCGDTCGDDAWPIEVRKGLFKCAPCSHHPKHYCTGRHDCGIRSLASYTDTDNRAPISIFEDKFKYLPTRMQQMDFTQLLSKLNQQKKLSTLEAARMLFLALVMQFKESRKTTDMPHETNTKVYAKVESDAVSWEHPPDWDFTTFTTSEAVNWETTTGKSTYNAGTGMNDMDMGACLEDGALEIAQVLYNKCNKQEQLEHLKDGVESSYNKTGGVILQSSHGIIMPVNSQQLLSESLLAWSLHNRKLRDQYMEWLFTLDLHCAANRQSESVCTVTADGGSITLFNPWVGGDFSVGTKCDVRRDEENTADVIDSRGNRKCNEGAPFGDFYENQVDTCQSLDGERPGARIVPKKSGANICKLEARRNTTCGHTQGLMGGYAGKTADTLYYPQHTLPNVEPGGIFVNPRIAAFRRTASSIPPLDTLESSLLKVHPDDIAGHHMRFVITEDDIMRVDELLLTGVQRGGVGGSALKNRVDEAKIIAGMRNPHTSFPRGGATSWLQWDESSEHLQNMLLEPDITEGAQHWTCPLRQRLFLSGMNARFRPTIPNGRRAAVMFRQHRTDATQHYRSHTVQQAGASHVHVNATIRTTNGFCYCQQDSSDMDSYEHCRQPVQTSGRCGFLQTLASLHDSTWRFSQVQKRVGGGSCVEQLDWPYTGGMLRDGRNMSHVRASNRSECNLLDRMHDFQYRYTHEPLSATIRNSYEADTLSMQFGDCHSARVFSARADEGVDFLQDNCYPVLGGRNSTHLQLQCTPTSGTPYLKVLSRLQAHRRSSRSARPRAVRCSQCAAPPKFFDATGMNETTPESSFGVLMREHSERVIAGTVRKQLQRVLCSAGDTNCDRLHRVLNVSSWVPGEFWDKFLTNVGALFLETVPSGASQIVNDSVYNTFEHAATHAETAYDSDTELWNTPWVWCTRMQPKCVLECEADPEECSQVCTWPTVDNTTETGTPHTVDGCTGTIPKETWLNPETRGDACVQKMLDVQASTAVTAAVDICDMDATMNELCKVIHAARNEIFSTNCFASGVCYAERFYYQPSIYSASNQEFVRSTVENFYVQINESSCPDKDARDAQAYKLNQANVKECPATSLEVVVDVIQSLRSILDKLMRILYFLAMVCVTVLRFLIEQSAASIKILTAELGRWFMLFIGELGAMFEAWADMIFELITNTGLGKTLKDMVEALCDWVNWCIEVFVFGAYCPLMLEIEKTLDTLGSAFSASMLFSGLGKGLTNAAADIRNSRLNTCSEDMLLTCKSAPIDDDGGPAFLPVSTRCWSTYISSLGDANSLSCSAADTCLTANLGGNDPTGEEKQMCGTCESTDLGFTRFGCDLVRKQCKCNVQTLVRSPCVNHEQCSTTVQNDATCDLIDHALDINTFGTTPCKQCTSRPICMVGLGERTGFCGCSQQPVEFSSCALTDVGKSMFPPVDALCMVTIGAIVRDDVASSSLYSTNYNELAAARCSMIDQAQRYCMAVASGAWESGFYVVGLAGLQQSSRRLLSSEIMLPTWSFVVDASLFDEVLYNSSWSGVQYEPCRSVPLLHANPTDSNYTLGIADKALLQSCVHWRAAAREVIHSMQMPEDFPDTFLLSMDDFTHDILSNYHHSLTLFVRHPHAIMRAIMHSPFMHPVRTVVRQCKQWIVHMLIEVQSISAHYKETNGTLVTSVHSKSVFSSLGYIGDWYNTFAKAYDLPQHNVLTELEDAVETMQQQMNGSLMMFIDSAPLRYTLKRSVIGKAKNQTSANNSESVSMNMSGVAPTLLVVSSSNTRRLLQDTTDAFLQRMQETQLYSWDVALGGGTTQIIGGSVAREFLEIPIGWPPQYVYWDSDGQCPILENTWGVVARSSNIMYRYYTNAGPEEPIVIRGIANVLNSIKPADVMTSTKSVESTDSLLSFVKKYLLQAATELGVTDTAVFGTFKLISANAENFFSCDIDAVVFCSEHHNGLLESAVVVALLLFTGTVIIALVVPASPMSSIAVIIFLSITIYFAFGVSPVCTPMIPTCLLSELRTTIETIFPVSVTIPRSLQRTPNCLEEYNTQRSLNATFTDTYDATQCIVSCSDTPFNFVDWYSNTAWLVCDLTPWCTTTREWVETPGNWLVAVIDQIMGVATSDNLVASLWRSSVVLQSKDASIIEAHRWCCVFTMWNVIPYFLILLFLLPAIPYSITIIISFVKGLIRVIFSYFTLSHTFTEISSKDIPDASTINENT